MTQAIMTTTRTASPWARAACACTERQRRSNSSSSSSSSSSSVSSSSLNRNARRFSTTRVTRRATEGECRGGGDLSAYSVRVSKRVLSLSSALTLATLLGAGNNEEGGARAEEKALIKRPKGYEKLAKEITKTIRSTIELEQSGASVAEIRKSGDPVKGLYRDLLTKYDSDISVNKDRSYISLTGVFQELGAFYRTNGPTARLSNEVQESVLAKLQVVDDVLAE